MPRRSSAALGRAFPTRSFMALGVLPAREVYIASFRRFGMSTPWLSRVSLGGGGRCPSDLQRRSTKHCQRVHPQR
eukprot:3935068-Pyramimonas_sp.AAC.1